MATDENETTCEAQEKSGPRGGWSPPPLGTNPEAGANLSTDVHGDTTRVQAESYTGSYSNRSDVYYKDGALISCGGRHTMDIAVFGAFLRGLVDTTIKSKAITAAFDDDWGAICRALESVDAGAK